MKRFAHPASRFLTAGDIDGLNRIYSSVGALVTLPNERVLAVWPGFDMAVFSGWSIFTSKCLVDSGPSPPYGRLYSTSARIVMMREVDIQKEIRPLLTEHGISGAERLADRLASLASRHGRYYAELWPAHLRLMKTKRLLWGKVKQFNLNLLSDDGARFQVFVNATAEHLPHLTELAGRFRSP